MQRQANVPQPLKMATTNSFRPLHQNAYARQTFGEQPQFHSSYQREFAYRNDQITLPPPADNYAVPSSHSPLK